MPSLNNSAPLRGVVPPLVTPLTKDYGLDLAGLKRLIEHTLSGGVHGLFILGTTGEGPSLPYQLRTALIESTCEIVNGRVPVLVGVTDTSLCEAVDMTRVAGAAGADAVVYAPPCYFPASQAELENAVRKIAGESPLPVVLYNMPDLTKTRYEIETVDALMNESNIMGVKDSSGDLAYFRRLVEVCKQRSEWSVMIGPEHLLAQAIDIGGHGGVSGGANVCPELFVNLYEAARRRDEHRVVELQRQLYILNGLYCLGTETGMGTIQGIKASLACMGICEELLCPPYATLASDKHELLEEILQSVHSDESAIARESLYSR